MTVTFLLPDWEQLRGAKGNARVARMRKPGLVGAAEKEMYIQGRRCSCFCGSRIVLLETL